MSDIITFNTEDAVKISEPKKQINIFKLVPETDLILTEVMPEFDFNNPPVNPSLFASTLVESCKYYRGYGLSANQCGFKYRVFVMGTNDDYVAFFNPEIINISKEENHMIEGCLSFPLLGLTSYVYFGSIIRDSRDFCVEHANKIFTEEEARQLWQNDWQGKSGSDPFIDRGGYNCRHHWQPVDPEWGNIKDDGTSWATGGLLITAKNFPGVAGIQNAGLAAGGTAGGGVGQSCTEEYNGTSWTAGGALATARYVPAGAGTQNEALVAGGYTGINVSCTEEYNGTSWTAGGSLITARRNKAGVGTQNATLVAGGLANAYPGTTCTEEYNGTSWSAGGNLITARFGLAGAGTQNETLVAAGYTNFGVSCTEEYNGTSWSIANGLITIRYYLTGAGSQGAGFVAGGFSNANVTCTEEYNKPIVIIDTIK